MSSFTHIDSRGHVKMVDVSEKNPTLRTAVACATISMNAETFERIQSQTVKKGNVLETARIAGTMAAKQTAALIPMCHPLNITHVKIDLSPDDLAHAFRIEAAVRVFGQTGVEMEALTAASVAALTVYDMCKSYDKEMVISDIYLREKSGGKSGTYRKNHAENK